ncbi:hypothetical protein [Salipaludibacillus aurantiacus]|uniref:HTH merR-type domain-containing protein n=1 Tax=Salipaludibacillus aurantiacus TaxID=1601833 RepID=A0A1H9V458_9BACI|nr:hypothetical protein [Salipaludibacillus aurantiacus]SES16164.1 hypothetical protein SAMN05518684_109129 [Salipaludibacillus aurantiacus]
MRHDIQPNERSYTTKEVAEELGIATPTVRKYGQVLERNGYEFFKERDRRVFVQSDIESLIALRDTNRPLDDTAKDLVEQQKKKLEQSNDTQVAVSGQYDELPQDPNQLKEILTVLAGEFAAARETNMQLRNDMDQLKTTVARLQQDHHVISSTIGNSAQKTNSKIEKLTEQQHGYYETMLEQEKEKNEFLQKELQQIREEQKKEWRLQNDFNKRLETTIKKRKGYYWDKLFALFRK